MSLYLVMAIKQHRIWGDEENKHYSGSPICSSMILAILLAMCLHVHAKWVNVHARVYIWYQLLNKAEFGGGEEYQSCSGGSNMYAQ